MKNNPLVSIMMPVYNGLPLIKASIESVINQTYLNWECIIVDDGSTDGTSEYLDSLPDSRFRIVHFKQNYGRAIARQKALDEAKGDYITMLDADDLMHSNRLILLLREFEKHPEVSLVGSQMCSFGRGTDVLRIRGEALGVICYDEKIIPTHAPSMIIATLAKQYSYNPFLKVGEDADFLRHYLKGRKYIILPHVLYYYSEFDSVTKNKILSSYKLEILNTQNSPIFRSLTFIKYICALILFPFFKIETILKYRGRPLSIVEQSDYYNNCKRLIDDVCNY